MLLSGLARSDLVRLLSGWQQGAGVSSNAPGPSDVAARLGQWFNPLQAERLHTTLAAIERHGQSGNGRLGDAVGPDPEQLAQQVESLRQALLDQWEAATCQTADGWSYSLLGVYAAWHQDAQQALADTRARLRSQLARGPARLQQLAALDALLEQTLAPKWQPVWDQLPQHVAAHVGEEALVAWPPPANTLATLQALVHAELQTALHPLLGLVQAALASRSEEEDGTDMDTATSANALP
jgi:Protein of unknown function (DUF3348)